MTNPPITERNSQRKNLILGFSSFLFVAGIISFWLFTRSPFAGSDAPVITEPFIITDNAFTGRTAYVIRPNGSGYVQEYYHNSADQAVVRSMVEFSSKKEEFERASEHIRPLQNFSGVGEMLLDFASASDVETKPAITCGDYTTDLLGISIQWGSDDAREADTFDSAEIIESFFFVDRGCGSNPAIDAVTRIKESISVIRIAAGLKEIDI